MPRSTAEEKNEMPINPSAIQTDFETFLTEHGTSITITNHTIWYSGLYEAAYYKTGSDVTTSGLAFFNTLGPQDLQILPQGQAHLFPRIMFVHGSVDIRADSTVVDSTGSRFQVIPGLGIHNEILSGTAIYHKAYIRAQLGSELEYA